MIYDILFLKNYKMYYTAICSHLPQLTGRPWPFSTVYINYRHEKLMQENIC